MPTPKSKAEIQDDIFVQQLLEVVKTNQQAMADNRLAMAENTQVLVRLSGSIDITCKTQERMQDVLDKLASRIDTNMLQRQDVVPMRSHLITVGILALIALVSIGLNIAGLMPLVGAP